MLRSGTRNRDWGDIVDVAIIAVATVLVLWPFVFESTIELGWSLANLTAIVYAGGDVVLLALLAALYFDGGRRTVSVTLMVISVALVFAGSRLLHPGVRRQRGPRRLGGCGVVRRLHSDRRRRPPQLVSSRSHLVDLVLDSPLRRVPFVGVSPRAPLRVPAGRVPRRRLRRRRLRGLCCRQRFSPPFSSCSARGCCSELSNVLAVPPRWRKAASSRCSSRPASASRLPPAV